MQTFLRLVDRPRARFLAAIRWQAARVGDFLDLLPVYVRWPLVAVGTCVGPMLGSVCYGCTARAPRPHAGYTV